MERKFLFPRLMLYTGENVAFCKSTLRTSLEHLIQNCSLMVGNSLVRQQIGIQMGFVQALFGTNLFLYTYENKYMSKLISNDKVKARHFHATKRFIDDLGTLNDKVYSMMCRKTSIPMNTLVPMPLS